MKRLIIFNLFQLLASVIVLLVFYLYQVQVCELVEHNKVINGIIVFLLVVIFLYVLADALFMMNKTFRWHAYTRDRRDDFKLFGMQYAGITGNRQRLIETLAKKLKWKEKTLDFLSGTLIGIGLLGTFVGLMHTMGSVFEVLGADVGGKELVARLGIPLSGMSTAFSASMLGLVSSLAVGFAALLTGKVSAEFISQLDEWVIRNPAPVGHEKLFISESLERPQRSTTKREAMHHCCNLVACAVPVADILPEILKESRRQSVLLEKLLASRHNEVLLDEVRKVVLRSEQKMSGLKRLLMRLLKRNLLIEEQVADSSVKFSAQIKAIREGVLDNTILLNEHNNLKTVSLETSLKCLEEINETKLLCRGRKKEG